MSICVWCERVGRDGGWGDGMEVVMYLVALGGERGGEHALPDVFVGPVDHGCSG